MMELLRLQNLSKSFGGITPVRDVSLKVGKQSITLLTGPNGAGKTTLFNLITGIERPSSGSIIYQGRDITDRSALEIARLGLVRLYQRPRLFKNLTVSDNLVAVAHGQHDSMLSQILRFGIVRREEQDLKRKAYDLLRKFDLHDLSGSRAGELSYGQQKLISFCMIAMNGTELALLDEPFAGLHPKTINQLSNMINSMKGEGLTFLIIEHNLSRALELADLHVHMHEGFLEVGEG